MGGKGKGWHGDSRLHSLARKGIPTKIDERRRFDVSHFVARGERHKIRYKQDFRRKTYNITIEKDKDLSLTVWEAEYLFYLQLNNPNFVERKFPRVSDSTKEKLKDIKVLNIEEIIEEEPEKESIFKALGKLKESKVKKGDHVFFKGEEYIVTNESYISHPEQLIGGRRAREGFYVQLFPVYPNVEEPSGWINQTRISKKEGN